MNVGTKSLLFGVHQFLWHPVTVLLAWWKLYGRPGWKEVVCIIIHDWGYWGCPDMDGAEGERHPELAADIALALFGVYHYFLCLLHSRHLARSLNKQPSRLCWADKFSIMYDPWWFYLPRAWLSGELKEYRKLASDAGFVPLSASHREWFAWVRDYLGKQGIQQKGTVLVNPGRGKYDGT